MFFDESLATIKNEAFLDAGELEVFGCGKKKTEVADELLDIKDLPLVASLTIEARAFSGCKNLHTVILPKCKKITIEKDAFLGCSAQTTMKGTVTDIAKKEFETDKTYSLVVTEKEPDLLILRKKLRNFYSVRFEVDLSKCTGLEDIYFPVDGLTKIVLPNSVVEIGDGAFKNCENLTEITVPDSVDRIDDFAFSDCTSLKRVEFLAEPSYIGKKVFDGCTHLEIIYCPRHLGEGFMFNGEYYGFAVSTSIGFTDGFESH
ncbi:MAG: leucine-rich repeat domain-containing protein [Treponema sp.]|nr:leucine-rich repeat domain-containing protein [Treponema sp.]